MLALFGKLTREKGTGSPTSVVGLEQYGVERICLEKYEKTPPGGIQGKGITANSDIDKSYIEMARGKYQKIKSIISGERKPTRIEKELISMIFNKMVDPYYYWGEAKVNGEKLKIKFVSREEYDENEMKFLEIKRVKDEVVTGQFNVHLNPDVTPYFLPF